MMNEYYILFPILAVYGLILLVLAIGFLRTSEFRSNENKDHLPLSIIICARNEEKTIIRCLKTIVQQEYDLNKLQILVINDASTDGTATVAAAILKHAGVNYRIISNAEKKGKKASIAYAMQFAEHPHIVLRDADTFTLSYSWLKCISDFLLQTKADMVIGPVAIADNSGALWALQAIENNIISVLAGGSAFYKKPFLCSGANLIFTRRMFEQTGSFQTHMQIASGDDILFMEEVKKQKGKICFLKSKEAIVSTYPSYSLPSLMNQKIRWVSKFSINKNPLNFFLALISLLVNISVLFCLFSGYLMPQNALFGLIFTVIKLLIDILLLFLASGFIKNRGLAWYVLPIGFIYPVYSLILAVSTLFVKPKWK